MCKISRGVVGWERVGTAFPHHLALTTLLEDLDYIKSWLRSNGCACDTQTCAAKSLQRNRKLPFGNSCRRMLTLFELFGAVFLFIWCGNAVSSSLFLALHPEYSS